MNWIDEIEKRMNFVLVVGRRYYTTDGFTVIVHEIKNGLVYFEKRLSHNSGKEWPQADETGWPLQKLTINAFMRQAGGRK